MKSRAKEVKAIRVVRGGQAVMRLRRASVIAALSLLAWAATASAECAWVQWSKTILPSGEDAWSMVAAYTQQEGGKTACEKAATNAKKQTQEGQGTVKGIPVRLCLPDSVDPRGPKR